MSLRALIGLEHHPQHGLPGTDGLQASRAVEVEDRRSIIDPRRGDVQ